MFAPDAKTLAANEATYGVLTWDTTSATDKRVAYRYPTWQPPAWSCYSASYGWGVAYTPDGQSLVAGGSNGGELGFVVKWDVTSGKPETLGCHETPVTAIAASPVEAVIASGDLKGKILYWDLVNGKNLAYVGAHDGTVFSICYSADGSLVVSGGADHVAVIWDAKSYREISRFQQHKAEVYCVAVSPNGHLAASCDSSGAVFIWDIFTGKVVAKSTDLFRSAMCLAFSPSGKTLALGGADGTIVLLSVDRLVAKSR